MQCCYAFHIPVFTVQLNNPQPVFLPFCFLTKYGRSKLYFARPHKPVLTFYRDRRTHGPQPHCAAGYKTGQCVITCSFRLTQSRVSTWGIFCGRNRLIPLFFLFMVRLGVLVSLPRAGTKMQAQSQSGGGVDRCRGCGGLFAEPGPCLPSSTLPRL